VSLTDDLRAGAPAAFAALYDQYAGPLHTYCHVMLGDKAADAARDAFVAVARHPDSVPADEDTLPVWLYALARAECVRHGAFVRKPATTPMSDPMWRALAGLDPEDRDVLALAASLVPEEIVQVLDMARGTAMTLVQCSLRRLEHALCVVGGQEAHDPVVLTSLDEDTLRRLMTRMYEPPEDQRDRVLAACASEAERTADETLIFAEDSPAEPEPEESGTAPASRDRRARRAERRREFRGRRIEGLLQVAALAALVLVAAVVMTVRSDHSSDGSSGDDGTGLSTERKRTAGPSVQAAPPPQAPPSAPPSTLPTTAPPGTVPTTAPRSTTPSTDRDVPLPPDDSTGAHPIPPPSFSDPSFHSHPPVHHSKTPIRPTPSPSDSPTGKDSGSPTPHPSGS
jgi:hypothetical protein